MSRGAEKGIGANGKKAENSQEWEEKCPISANWKEGKMQSRID